MITYFKSFSVILRKMTRTNANANAKNVIRFSSIKQFREIISSINDTVKYHNLTTKPTLKFRGLVKLHGTNAAIVYTPNDGIMIQSRNNLYKLEDMNKSRDASHMGFNEFAHKPETNTIVKHIYDSVVNHFYNDSNSCNDNNTKPEINNNMKIVIYGEWAKVFRLESPFQN